MKKSGFTLAETLLTLAIIGVCAAMLITSIKNLRTDDLSNDIMAKKALSSFSDAVKQVILHNTENNKMDKLVTISTDPSTGAAVETACESAACLMDIFGKYLHISKTFTDSTLAPTGLTGTVYGIMGDGLIFGLTYNKACNISQAVYPMPAPSDGAITSITTKNACGIIYYDVNGSKGPNAIGIDQLSIPIKKSGIKIPYITQSGSSSD